MAPKTATLDAEAAVRERYEKAARAREAQLCCPATYDPKYLEVIPQEILEKDYGCGDPTHYLRPGDTVLDLGSGAGKICYIAAQIVGAKGRVIGVNFNPAMLSLARKYQLLQLLEAVVKTCFDARPVAAEHKRSGRTKTAGTCLRTMFTTSI